MGQFDSREPSQFEVMYRIVELSVKGISKKCISQIFKCSCYPIQLDPFYKLLTERGLIHLTGNYCKATNKGEGFIDKYSEIASWEKIKESGKNVDLILIKILSSDNYERKKCYQKIGKNSERKIRKGN